ncbi:MAG: hypothetical protein WBQ36_01765, partial [Desulfobaccales bacterium]
MRIYPQDGMISKHHFQQKFPEGQGIEKAKGGMRFAFPPLYINEVGGHMSGSFENDKICARISMVPPRAG